jgi:membrane-bound lytic murein transglycosylase D
MKRLLLFVVLCLSGLLSRFAAADQVLLPRPPQLEPDVHFWVRVYTEISTNEGFIHDQHELAVVYETLHFAPDSSARERERRVDAERMRYHDMLLRLARGAEPATDEERHVRALWGEDAHGPRLAAAADDVRFQLGQSDRFRAGLIRSGAWEHHIGEVLSQLGLPSELSALPHVESSFDPTAYSKVGAAGLWQFMRSTGRRFLRIDGAVDERLDPFRETEAAAQLLAYNYRLLGSWPLAITAYNHGAGGVRHAMDQLGTDDIVRIVRNYHSPSFGFASRNFYVSFLAALSVAQEPQKYFPAIAPNEERRFHEIKLPARAAIPTLLQTLALDRDALRSLNPALRPAVWAGRRPVPAGYVLRLPEAAAEWNSTLLAQRLAAVERTESARPVLVAANSTPVSATAASVSARLVPGPVQHMSAAPEPVSGSSPSAAEDHLLPDASSVFGPAGGASADASQYYVVGPDDDLASIAARTGVMERQLMKLNEVQDQDDLYTGERLRLSAAADPDANPELIASAREAVQERREDDAAAAAASTPAAAAAEPVSASQAQAEGPQLVPGTAPPHSPDPVDYSVQADGSIRVVAAETLGHYADWLGVSAARLRALNHLRGRTPVVMGRRLKLEFTNVTESQFEQRRREYHDRLEAVYFASHRIRGSETYLARRGDSLWNITKRNTALPVWLLQQYNPDLDFANLKPGTPIALPKVEATSTL